jgi:antitoxin component of RelBE/YafQ-DinJ toxin-antitoxin module
LAGVGPYLTVYFSFAHEKTGYIVGTMSQTTIQITIDAATASAAEAALAARGLSMQEVLERLMILLADTGPQGALAFLRNSSVQWGTDAKMQWSVIDLLDEPLLTPNAETIEAIEAARRGEFIGEFKTVEELRAYLNSYADD